MPTDELLDLIRVYAQERYPRFAVARLVIEMHDGDKMKLRVPDFPTRPPANQKPTDDAPALTRTERRILQKIADMTQEESTGQEIATAAKLPYEAHFKKLLSAMRTKGLLSGDRRDVGYAITPLGLAAIEPRDDV